MLRDQQLCHSDNLCHVAGMRLLPVFERGLDVSHGNPVTSCLAVAIQWSVRVHFPFFDSPQQLEFANRTNLFVAKE